METAADRACVNCGASLAPDQQYCLDCGALNARRRRSLLPRSAGLAVPALVLAAIGASAAYAITQDTKPGRHVALGRPAAPTTPPAATTPPPASSTPTTPQPPTTTPAAPPPHATHVPKTTPSAPPATPAPSNTTPSTPSTGGGSSSGGTTPHSNSSTPGSTKQPSHHKAVPASEQKFTSGDTPYSASLLEPSGGTGDNPNDTGVAVDDDVHTAWTTSSYTNGQLGKSGVGLVIDSGGYKNYGAVGLLTKTPGSSIEIYTSSQTQAPTAAPPDPGWTLVGKKSGVGARQRIGLKGSGTPRWYLVWITALPSGKPKAGISEVSLLP